MNDLINRQWLIECVEEGWIKFETEKDKNKFIHLVRDTAPSVQTDIIRCRDCKYWDAGPSCSAYPDLHVCIYWMRRIVTEAEDFCSRAERREE